MAAATTVFAPASGSFTMVTPDASGGTRSVVSRAATIKNLYIVASAANGSAKTNTYTVMKNGTAQTVTCNIVNVTTCNDTSNSFTVVAGDEIGIKLVTAASSTLVKHSWSMELQF